MSLLTVREVGERVRLSEWAIRRAINDGELEAFKVRGRIRIDEGAVEAWLAGSVVASVPERRVRRVPVRSVAGFKLPRRVKA